MVDTLPIKTIGAGETRKFAEFATGDTVPVDQGGTGADNPTDAKTNLEIVNFGDIYVRAVRNDTINTNETPSNPNNILIGTFPRVYLTLTTVDIPFVSGSIYEFDASYFWNGDNINQDFLARINRDNGTQFFGFHRQEPKDALGGLNPDAPDGSGTNQRYPAFHRRTFLNMNGVHTFRLETASGLFGSFVSMISAQLTFKRVK